MKILLVEPRTPDTFWSLRHALRFVGKKAANPPLGLITLAVGLEDRFRVRLSEEDVPGLVTFGDVICLVNRRREEAGR